MLLKEACRMLMFLAAACAVPVVHGEPIGDLEFSGSGFLTVGVGKMLGGTHATVLDRNCPCFIADYAQGAVYDGRSGLQWGQDSKLGLQGTATLPNANFSVTAQAVARGAHNGNIDLEWLYGSYQLTDNTVIQFGRKRLPMFYYSDIQDVGFALPWTHLPPQLYGWEMVNYNGVNIRHQARWGDWAATINALAGNENVSDSGYWEIYNGKRSRTRVKLNNIIGGDLTLARDWFETRLVYIQSGTQRESFTIWDDASQNYLPANDPGLPGNGTRQNIYGIALNMDPGDWIFRSELLYINRPGATYKDYAQLVGIGRRFGEWQLMATASHYGGEAVVANGGDPQGQENHTSRSLTLRYNLTQTSDIKMQLDSQKDQGGINWAPRYGEARLLTLSYDVVF